MLRLAADLDDSWIEPSRARRAERFVWWAGPPGTPGFWATREQSAAATQVKQANLGDHPPARKLAATFL